MLVGDIVDPYFAEIARGVEDVATSVGHLTMVCGADRRPAAEFAHLDVLRDYHAAGVVFPGSGYEDVAEAAALREAVAACRRAAQWWSRSRVRDLDCPSVWSTTGPGHARRPSTCCRSGTGGSRSSRGRPGAHRAHRLEGFRAAIAAAGAEAGACCPAASSSRQGAAAAEKLHRRESYPDAVLGVNDEVAIGLLTGLRRGGVDVPGRVSVAGIDDTRPARLVDLTSVSLPLHELGESAARVILEGAEGDMVLPHRLVRRATTAHA